MSTASRNLKPLFDSVGDLLEKKASFTVFWRDFCALSARIWNCKANA